MNGDMHISRRRSRDDTDLDPHCDCGRAACGYVIQSQIDESCPQHSLTAFRTIRSSHAEHMCTHSRLDPDRKSPMTDEMKPIDQPRMTAHNVRDLLIKAAKHADAASMVLSNLVTMEPKSEDDARAIEHGLAVVRAYVEVSHAYSQASRAGSAYDRTTTKITVDNDSSTEDAALDALRSKLTGDCQ